MSENQHCEKPNILRNGLRSTFEWIGDHSDGFLYYAVLLSVLLILGTAAYRYRGIEPLDTEAAPAVETTIEENIQTDLPSMSASAFWQYKEPPLWPVSTAEIINGFQTDSLAWNEDLQQWQTHEATDLAANAGEAVFAVLEGVVTEAYTDPLYGNTVIIDHGDGRVISYSSLNTLNLVSTGQKVKRGEVIGAAGNCIAEHSVGTHVHIEFFLNGERRNLEELMKAEYGNTEDPLQD